MKKTFLLLLILLAIFLIIGLIIFKPGFDRDKADTVNIRLITGNFIEINNGELIIAVDNRGLVAATSEIPEKEYLTYYPDKQTEFFSETVTTISEEDFSLVEKEIGEKAARGENVEAPSWFKKIKISQRDLKKDDKLKLYYYPDSLRIYKVVVLNKFEGLSDYARMKSDVVMSMTGEINDIDLPSGLISIQRTDIDGGESKNLKTIELSENTGYFVRSIKDEKTFYQEQEEFNKAFLGSSGDSAIDQNLSAPEWFIYQTYDPKLLKVNDEILANFTANENTDIIKADKIILIE